MSRLLPLVVTVVVLLAGCVASAQNLRVPLTDVRLVPVSGIKTIVSEAPDADMGAPAMCIQFTKEGEERRLLAFDAMPESSPAGAKARVIAFSCAGSREEVIYRNARRSGDTTWQPHGSGRVCWRRSRGFRILAVARGSGMS